MNFETSINFRKIIVQNYFKIKIRYDDFIQKVKKKNDSTICAKNIDWNWKFFAISNFNSQLSNFSIYGNFENSNMLKIRIKNTSKYRYLNHFIVRIESSKLTTSSNIAKFILIVYFYHSKFWHFNVWKMQSNLIRHSSNFNVDTRWFAIFSFVSSLHFATITKFYRIDQNYECFHTKSKFFDDFFKKLLSTCHFKISSKW